MAIGTALKLLEKEGYLARPNERTSSAYLKMKININTVIEELKGKQKNSFTKLCDKFSTELEKGWRINLEEVSSLLEIKKDSLQRLIKKGVEQDWWYYEPPFRGTEVKILKKVCPDDIELNLSALKEKMKKAYEKLDLIENYIYHSGCRQQYILEYFGENKSFSCGKCDRCLKPKKEYLSSY
jgi:ATP-dependent DNA helicase RecQ